MYNMCKINDTAKFQETTEKQTFILTTMQQVAYKKKKSTSKTVPSLGTTDSSGD